MNWFRMGSRVAFTSQIVRSSRLILVALILSSVAGSELFWWIGPVFSAAATAGPLVVATWAVVEAWAADMVVVWSDFRRMAVFWGLKRCQRGQWGKFRLRWCLNSASFHVRMVGA